MAIEEVNNQEEEEENDFFDYAGDILAAPFRGVEGAIQGAYNLADYLAFDVLPDYDTRFLGTSKTMAGGLVEGVAQFATGFVPIFGAAGRAGMFAKAGKAAGAVRAVTAGAITDFTFFNGQEARLSNLIQQYPELQNPVTEFLAHDAEEGEIEGRLKNVLEGLGLEAVAGVFISGLRGIKAGRDVRNNGGTPEEAAVAQDKVLQGGRVFVDDEAQIAARREREETDELYRMVGGDPEDIPEVDLRTINWDEVDMEEAVDVAPAVAREEMEAIEAGGRLVDERETATAIVKTYEMPGGSTRTVMVDKANPERVVEAAGVIPKAPEQPRGVDFAPGEQPNYYLYDPVNKQQIGPLNREQAQRQNPDFFVAQAGDKQWKPLGEVFESVGLERGLKDFNKRILSDLGIGKPGVVTRDDVKVEKIIEDVEDLPDADKIFSLEEFDRPAFWGQDTLNFVLQKTSVTKSEFYNQAVADTKNFNLRGGMPVDHIDDSDWTAVLTESEFLKVSDSGVKLDTIKEKLTPEGIAENEGIKGKLKKDLQNAGISESRIKEMSDKFKDFFDFAPTTAGDLDVRFTGPKKAGIAQEFKEKTLIEGVGQRMQTDNPVTAREALQELVDKTGGRLGQYQPVIDRLLALGKGTGIDAKLETRAAASDLPTTKKGSFYESGKRRIVFDGDSSSFQQNPVYELLHESTHAVTVDNVNKYFDANAFNAIDINDIGARAAAIDEVLKQRLPKPIAEMFRMFKKADSMRDEIIAKGDLKTVAGEADTYWIKNPAEFMSMAFSDPIVQRALKGIEYDPKMSLWEKIVDTVKRLLGKGVTNDLADSIVTRVGEIAEMRLPRRRGRGTVDFLPPTKAFGADIDPKTKEFLLKGDTPKTVSNTLDQLTTNAKSPEVRNLAENLKELIGDPEDLNVPIKYKPEAAPKKSGQYDLVSDEIELYKWASEETLVHEILHGVTSRKLVGWAGKSLDKITALNVDEIIKNEKAPKAVRELARSYDKAVQHSTGRIRLDGAPQPVDLSSYPMGNLDEFLVGAFTNKEFQQQLSKIPVEDNRNLFQKLVDTVAKLIGVKTKGTLLEKVIRDSAEIISSSRKQAVSPEFTKGLTEFDSRFKRPQLRFSKKEPEKFLQAVPEKFRGYAEALLEGGTPRLPQFALETGDDVVVLKEVLEGYYKENPDKITVQGAITDLDTEIEQQFMLQQGKDAATKIAEARVVQQSLRDQSKGVIENLTAAVEEYTKAGGGSAAVAKLKNNFQQLLNVADIYRQIGRETGITLQARRENFRSRKIGLSQSDIEIEGLRNQFINASGGMHPDKLVNLIKETIDKENPDSMIAAMFKIANKAQGKHFLDMPTEYWMNAILSGPKTQMVNIMGNSLTQLMSTLEAVAGGLATGNVGVVKAVVASWADGQMIREAAKFAKNAFKQNDNLLDPQARSFSDRPQGAITGDRIASGRLGGIVTEKGLTSKKSFDAMGNFIRIPGRLLLTTDEFFKQLAYRRAARLKATMSGIQQGIKDPKQLAEHINKTLDGIVTEGGRMASEEGLAREAADIAVAKKLEGVEKDKFILKYVKENFDKNKSALMQYAQDEAQYLTFTRELQDKTLGKVLQEATNKLPMLRLVLPFVRTPTNLLKYAFERTPGIVVLREERQRLLEDLKSGDPVRRSQAMGKMMTALTVGGVFLDTAYNNREYITGGGPRDEKKKAALMATGWRPYSIKIGDTYYSYQRLDPLSTLLGVGADLVEVGLNDPKAFDESGLERTFLALTLSITRNATNKSYLAGIQNFTDALSDPDRYMAKFGQNFTSSFVPNIISQMADYDTQAQREVRNIGDAFARKLGIRSGLDKKRNLLGEEYLTEQWMGTGFINPIAMSPFKDDPVLAEMASLNHAFRQPAPNLGGQVDMLAHENAKGQTAYDRQLELLQSVKVQGETLRSALTRLVKSNQYQSLEALSEPGLPSPRVQKINSLLTRYRKEAKRQMLTEFPELSEQYSRLTAARAGLKGGMQREDVLELLTQ